MGVGDARALALAFNAGITARDLRGHQAGRPGPLGARIRQGKVAEWRVWDDTPENRVRLGL